MKKFLTLILPFVVFSVLTLHGVKTDASALEANACLIPLDQAAPDFQDLKQVWCEDSVKLCCQAGLLKGKTTDHFDEKSALTNAQITVITARLYEKLTGGDCHLTAEQDALWYAPSYELLKTVMPDVIQSQMDLETSFLPDLPNRPCSRLAFAELLAGVLKAAEVQLPEKNVIDAIPDITAPNVRMLYRAGVLTGTDPYGFFHGASSLTRGQAAAMLARLVDPGARMEVTLEPFDFSEQILGVSSDPTLLSVNGEAITANECGSALCLFLLREVMANGYAPADAVELALADYCREVVAPLSLASERNLSLTQEELDRALSSAQAAAGYMGRNAESWYHENCQEVLIAKVERFYADNALSLGSFDAAVNAKCMELSVEETAAFRDLDAEAIYRNYHRLFL